MHIICYVYVLSVYMQSVYGSSGIILGYRLFSVRLLYLVLYDLNPTVILGLVDVWSTSFK